VNLARMYKAPRAARDAYLFSLTPEQLAALRYGYELTPEQAHWFVHCSEHYAHLAFLADRDALHDTEAEDRQNRVEYRRERADVRAQFGGRARHLIESRRRESDWWRRPFAPDDLPF
jgi:hypothetical protein